MLEAVKNNLKRKKFVALTLFIVAGTQSPSGYALVPEKDAKELKTLAPEMIEINEAVKDASGNVAVRATVAGIAAAAAEPAAASASAPAAEAPKFVIESNVPLPPIQRGGLRNETYPFASLEVGQSFFVAKTDAKQNPAKSLAGTVSSASRRYKGQTPERKFTVRAVEGGARVWRTV